MPFTKGLGVVQPDNEGSPRVRCSQTVEQPYKLIRNALVENAHSIFQSATKGATPDAESFGAELHAQIGGIEVAKEVAVSITNIERDAHARKSATATRFDLEWRATSLPQLFPVMKAELLVYPLSGIETRLDFSGAYEPPAGALGGVIDSVVGHRIAEESVQRFVDDVASYLSAAPLKELGGKTDSFWD